MHPRDAAPDSEPPTEDLPADGALDAPATRAGRHERITQAWLRSLGAASRRAAGDDRTV